MEARLIQNSDFNFLRFSRWLVWGFLILFWVLFGLHVSKIVNFSASWRLVVKVGLISASLGQPILYEVERRRKNRTTAQ
jgi:hypothetical protein